MKNSNTVQSIVYFNEKCNSLFIIKPPNNPTLHHKAFMIIGAVVETQINTFFILPLLMFILTYSFMMNGEFKSRVVMQCLDFENDETGELPNDIIFDHSKDKILSQGFMVYRTMITTKYIMYSILIYYATLGLLI